MILPSSELIKMRILHLLPQVRLTWIAFLSWFLGPVMTQHNTRTFSFNSRAASSSPAKQKAILDTWNIFDCHYYLLFGNDTVGGRDHALMWWPFNYLIVIVSLGTALLAKKRNKKRQQQLKRKQRLTNRRGSLHDFHANQNHGQDQTDDPCPPHCGCRRDRVHAHAHPHRGLPDIVADN